MTRKVCLAQYPIDQDLSEEDHSLLLREKPHFLCFPEYYFVSKSIPNLTQNSIHQSANRDKLKRLSSDLSCTIIGGTMISQSDDKFKNTSYICSRGEELGSYDKINLFASENNTLTPGTEQRIFHAEGLIFSVIICADVFKRESFTNLTQKGVQLIFIPTFSPLKDESVEKKFQRDREIFLAGAGLSQSYIVKVCSVGSLHDKKAQGRSLVCSPTEILLRVPPEDEQKPQLIFTDLSFPD